MAGKPLPVFGSAAAEWLHELMLAYVSLAEDANCVNDGMVVRAGMAIELFDNAITACDLMSYAYKSDGNTKLQKAAHAAVRAVTTTAIATAKP